METSLGVDAVREGGGHSDDLRARLNSALRTSTELMRARDEQRWAATAGSLDRVVLFGCAQVGRDTLKGLRVMGVEPLAFADHNPAAQGTTVKGLPVLSAAEAVATYGTDATFIATLFNPVAVVAQLTELGCTHVAPYTTLYRAFPETFLPYLSFGTIEGTASSTDALRELFDHYGDETSRLTLVELVEWWASGDATANSQPPPLEEIYLAPDLFSLGTDETYVDCGAFDGDSIVAFLKNVDGRAREVIALEPDARNAAEIPGTIARGIRDLAGKPAVTVHTCAAGKTYGVLRFAATNTMASLLSDDGDVEVEVRRLDDLLADDRPTYLKADVEGGELDLLDGASETIARGETIWALTCYHAQEHIWEIPARFLAHADKYTFHFRRYREDCWETVFYAVPRSRSLTIPAQRESAA